MYSATTTTTVTAHAMEVIARAELDVESDKPAGVGHVRWSCADSYRSCASSDTMTSPASPSTLALLADPPVRLVDGAAMDYLLIEAVTALRASAAVAAARAKKIEQEMADAGLLPPPPPSPVTKPPQSHRDSIGSTTSRTQATSADDDEDEGVRTRLEAIGLHVGGNFVERCDVSKPSGSRLDFSVQIMS